MPVSLGIARRAGRYTVALGLAVLACSPADTGAGSGGTATPGSDGASGDPPATATETTTPPPATGGGSSGEASTAASLDTTATDDSTGEGMQCEPVSSCQAPLPNAGPTIDWEHFESSLVVASGSSRHRGRDMFYNPGDTQWVMAKFAYGLTDWDLEDERVDLFLLRNCEGEWEGLGSTFTTYEDDHPTVEGVVDTGGRLYFQIPEPLPVGRHRIHMVVRGDDTRADTYLEIVEPGTPIILSDIDGTLTTFEWERFVDFLLDTVPDANPGSPEALHLLVERGYRPMYLTARPEFLGDRTYAFIEERGFPPGIIHTTLSATGAMGSAAVEYKAAEFAVLASRGLVPAWVFGNTDSDAEAYDISGIQPLEQRIFFQHEDPFGGRTIESYNELLGEFATLPNVCQ
ncbi:MAG: phosphatidylinositol transfer protein [Deltaproteobacteria bacterium]|nr:phosphatidylinositol transfer protein [Deltaproteobacteria bacterium]